MGLYSGAGSYNLARALIAYWPGNEANGNLLDAHINALHLTDTNTVTSNPGRVFPTARQYARANNEYHVLADNALLRAGNVDFTFAAWVYMDSKSNNQEHSICAKGRTLTEYQFYVYYATGTNDLFVFAARNAANTATSYLSAITSWPIPLSNWHLVVGWYDAGMQRMHIAVNNGRVNSLAHSGGVRSSTNEFRIGSNTINAHWPGRIGPSMIWKSNPGCGGVLSAEQREAIWNGGKGLTYNELCTTAVAPTRRQWFFSYEPPPYVPRHGIILHNDPGVV